MEIQNALPVKLSHTVADRAPWRVFAKLLCLLCLLGFSNAWGQSSCSVAQKDACNDTTRNMFNSETCICSCTPGYVGPPDCIQEDPNRLCPNPGYGNCLENENVMFGGEWGDFYCAACPDGTTNEACDNLYYLPDRSPREYPVGNGPYVITQCDATPSVCAENEFVSGGNCVACPAGTTNAAGDDASGADTSCDAAPLVLMDAKSEVVPVLLGLLPTGDSKTDNRINKAISSIYKSLDPGFWADGNHLTSDGKKVFDEEKKAVKELMKIKAALAEVDDAIVALVAIDAGLAQIALDEATAGGGDPSYIAKAENEMVKADDEIANDKFDKAIDHFKKAWENALKAQD